MPLPKLVDDSRFEARRQESTKSFNSTRGRSIGGEKQLESSAEGRIAREYLTQREITDETQKTFRLGYAPDSWDALSLYLPSERRDTATDRSQRSGCKKEEGGSYDRFRGRLMFPVFDHQGRPIAFGGRTLKTKTRSTSTRRRPRLCERSKSVWSKPHARRDPAPGSSRFSSKDFSI